MFCKCYIISGCIFILSLLSILLLLFVNSNSPLNFTTNERFIKDAIIYQGKCWASYDTDSIKNHKFQSLEYSSSYLCWMLKIRYEYSYNNVVRNIDEDNVERSVDKSSIQYIIDTKYNQLIKDKVSEKCWYKISTGECINSRDYDNSVGVLLIGISALSIIMIGIIFNYILLFYTQKKIESELLQITIN